MTTNSSINTTNPIGVASGGTGAATLTTHGVLVGAGTGAVAGLTALTNGQVLLGSTGANPVPASITAGANITLTPGAGTLTIAADTGGITWSSVTTSGDIVAANGYISDGAGTDTLTLPATATVGDTFRVVSGAQAWIIAQNASQSIIFGTSTTTAGTGGSLASSAAGDAVEIVCTTTNTGFTVLSAIGNLTVV